MQLASTRSLEDCRKRLGLSRADFAKELGIDRKTYYNWCDRGPPEYGLRLANLLAERVTEVTTVREVHVDRDTLAYDMEAIHRLRSLKPTPITWKRLAYMASASPNTLRERYGKWITSQQSSSLMVSQPTTSTRSTTAIVPS